MESPTNYKGLTSPFSETMSGLSQYPEVAHGGIVPKQNVATKWGLITFSKNVKGDTSRGTRPLVAIPRCFRCFGAQ